MFIKCAGALNNNFSSNIWIEFNPGWTSNVGGLIGQEVHTYRNSFLHMFRFVFINVGRAVATSAGNNFFGGTYSNITLLDNNIRTSGFYGAVTLGMEIYKEGPNSGVHQARVVNGTLPANVPITYVIEGFYNINII